MKLIELNDIAELAVSNHLEPSALMAVIKVEGSGKGFDASTGKILIQFEPYHFQRYTGNRVANGVENQPKEWIAFNEAWKLDKEAAMLSTSWGMMQVMGFNHKAAGFQIVDAMIDAFKESEFNQVKGAINFIKSNPAMFKALQIRDWATFARGYNGPLFKKLNYDNRLKDAYQQSKELFN
ncbi:N-acetylmuramidase family protein [Solitalea lacus]|uniref:N-acetylmuramidase family protein n=1 Tax=Solitalea lacus TaxID=2911172 RepID=UPI001EDB2F7E|nr:N-acetylmuramidase family protein [Solitalea lacus]UKJ09066.1 N-acetylmuramidase family protein [Solitalea lacus]